MNQNGMYSPTSFKFKVDVCKVMGSNMIGQNPFIQALFGMLKKTGKLPASCPLKKVSSGIFEKLKIFTIF
jgi:hypothetical protein